MIQMAEPSAMNSELDNKVDGYASGKPREENGDIKREVEAVVVVKPEVVECAVCAARSPESECRDMFSATSPASGVSLHHLLCKLTRVDLADALDCSKLVCRTCVDLLNLLDRAELEYHKLREAFRAIIGRNPLFDAHSPPAAIALAPVKTEDEKTEKVDEDSEDEPLARTKKRRYRKVDKRKKKPAPPKRKLRARSSEAKDSSDSWECAECGVHGVGGAVGVAAHTLASHTIDPNSLRDVKSEHSADGSQSPLFNNAFDSCLKIEFDKYYDSSSEASDMISLNHRGTKNSKKCKAKVVKTIKVKPPAIKKRNTSKEVHQCDQCNAKYTSWIRLERHKQKHEGSKPPYICEVCGAHYKHKRACDIHIALHKGISDWKCEECNKLFPSKSALQRHNNIHTGKLNYQCDQCGKSFIHTSSFKMHKLSHSGVKPHACDVCGLALMTRSHLKRHKRVHSGEKRHECPVCGKRFSERYNLVAHTKSHEPGAEAAAAAAAAAAGPRRRLFRCAFCPERFERRYMLERHASVVHGRTLERPPPTPRNTMSKLLKAQAQRQDRPPPHADPHPHPDPHPDPPNPDPNPDPDKEPAPPTITPQKLIAQLSSSSSSSMITMGSWSGAYATEFGLRHDYSH